MTAPSTDSLLAATSGARGAGRLVHWLSGRLGPVRRRDLFVGAAVAGSALATSPRSYALRPVTAYSTICGPGNTPGAGWSIFCATVNKGANTCPPGSFAAGWWKAAGSSWCGGGYRYIVDCNAQCSKCTSGCSDHICDSACWNCSCSSGSTATCDQRLSCCNAFRYGQCNTQVSCSGGVHCRLVSCVPPYQWERCITTSFSDDRTAEHSSPYLPQWGAISSHYTALGDRGSWLGASLGPVRVAQDGLARGTYVKYQNGFIYDTPTTAASAVSNWVWQVWASVGGTNGVLGYPTRDRYVGLKDGGWLQPFEKGCIVDSQVTTTQVVWGYRWTVWQANGREGGVLGYPTGPVTYPAGGWIQTFQQGCLTDSTVTTTQLVTGAMWTAYRGLGLSGGSLGYPTGAVAGQARGASQSFQKGQLWALSGTSAYAVLGRVLTAWQAAGGAAGRYGYPLANTTTAADGTMSCRFEGGTITA